MDSSPPPPTFLLPQLIDSDIEKGSLASDPKYDVFLSSHFDTSSNEESASESRSYSESNQSPQGDERMVIHFDINETILIGDRAGGDTVEDCLNKVLAKSAFVKMTASEETISTLDSNSGRCTKHIVPTQWGGGGKKN